MTLFIRLLGQAEIKHDDNPLKLKGHKPLALLAYLLVTGKAHTRQHLVDLLYDSADDPRRSLRWTLNQLRQTIGADYLVANRQQISFNFDSDYWLDVDALEAGETELYLSEFLEGIHIRDAYRFMDWAFFQRERLRQIYETSLLENLVAYENQGQYEVVIDLGHRLIQLDNLREDWYQTLMRAYALLGNREAALAQYEVCREALAAELGAEPSQEITNLYKQIQAGTLADPRSLADLPVQYPSFLQSEGTTEVAEDSPIFVARELELAQLNQFLERALAGKGQVAFVIGGAGRGKTALLTEFARRAQTTQPDLLMAIGNCDLYSGIGDPFLPFRDVMGMLTGDVATKLATGAITHTQARRLWASLLPTCQAILDHSPNLIDVLVLHKDLLARAKEAAPPSAHQLEQLQRLTQHKEATTSELVQENLFQQLTNVLQTLAARQPLLLLLDDMQWADATSISLLFHLGRRLTGSRILIIGAYRPEEVAVGRSGERHPLEQVLAEFKRMLGDIWVDLGQTGQTADRQFIDVFLDTEPNQLGSAFRQALYQHTYGHPLFTVELLRAMRERGSLVQNEQRQWIEGDSLSWEQLPAKVEAVIEERIGRLEEDLRQVLTVASVDGEEFTAQVVARVQAVSERRLLSQLTRTLAKKHRLVRGQGEMRVGNRVLSRYQFVHMLFQRYLYNELSMEERRLLHAEIGEVLETLYGDHAAQIAVQLAWHFQEAKIPEKARPYLQQAGEWAVRHYANDEAVAYFSHALKLVPESAQDERYKLLLAREKVYALQGERDRQKQDLTTLHKLAETLDDDYKQAEVALRWSNYSETTSDYLATISMARTAISLAQAVEDLDSEVQGYLYWGRALWRQGDYETAQTQLERALDLAKEFPLLKARCLRILGLISWNQGDFVKARDHFEPSLLICRQIGDRQIEGNVHNNLGIISAQQGDYSEANAYFEQSLGICRQIGDRHVEGNVLNNLGIVAGYQSDYIKASNHYAQALLIKREIGDRQGQAMVFDNLGDVSRYQGDYTQAKLYFEQSLLIRQEIGELPGEANVLNNLGNVAHYQGDYRQARAYYEQSFRIRREIGERQGEAESLSYLSLLFHHQGDDEAARNYSKETVELAQELGDHHLLGYALTHLGHALVGLGDLSGAIVAYQKALDIRRELGEYNRALEPLAGLARVALAQNNVSAAQTLVEEILDYLETDTPAAVSTGQSLQGTEEPFRVFLACYHVLRNNQDPRARNILNIAHRLLQEQAANISDEDLRYSFLETVVAHRELLTQFARLNLQEGARI